jgi:hypothetical protein
MTEKLNSRTQEILEWEKRFAETRMAALNTQTAYSKLVLTQEKTYQIVFKLNEQRANQKLRKQSEFHMS